MAIRFKGGKSDRHTITGHSSLNGLVRRPRGEHRPDGKGGYFITLPHGVVDRLNYLREPGQSYSDVILALAMAE